MIRRPLIVGGSRGIGLAIATALAQKSEVDRVYIVDMVSVQNGCDNPKFKWSYFNLVDGDYSFFNRFSDIDTLVVTAGFGHLELFKDIKEEMIDQYFLVNALPAIKLIKKFYPRLEGKSEFNCCVLGSMAGFLSSPYLSVYAATKAAPKVFIESVNVELKKGGSTNVICNVCPGSIDSTSFNGEQTQLEKILPLAEEIISRMEKQCDLFIPDWEVYSKVLSRYHYDFRAEGEKLYGYRKKKIDGDKSIKNR